MKRFRRRGSPLHVFLRISLLCYALSIGHVIAAADSNGKAPASADSQSQPSASQNPVMPASAQTSNHPASTLDKKTEQFISVPSDNQDINYVVGITSKPQNSEGKTVKGRRKVMTTKSGVKFDCTIPSEDDALEKENSPPVSATTLVEKFRQNFSSVCLEKNVGYWTYRVCPFKEVVQFHREPSGAQGSLFQLGTYVPEADALPTSVSSYTQIYKGGTDGRASEVRFVCPKPEARENGKKDKDKDKDKNNQPERPKEPAAVVSIVTEPRAHHYDITIETPVACTPVLDSEQSYSNSASVLRILAPLKQDCIIHHTGWWTYEFCYLDKIRQFHSENSADPNGKPVVSVEYFLGRYMEAPSEEQLQSLTTIRRGVDESYVSQIYADGTTCDLTAKPRKTEVRFICNERNGHNHIASVAESSTCNYILKVATPLLCVHPYFKPTEPALRTIVCEPIKDTNQVRIASG